MTAPGEEKERTTIEKKFDKHAGTKKQQKYWDNRKRYVDQYIGDISKPFCNFADKYDTIKKYKKILRWDFPGEYTPIKLRVDCTLYHGCDYLLEGNDSIRKSKEVYLTQTVNFNQVI